MNKIALTLVLLAAAHVLSQSCDDNPLLSTFDLPAQDSPVTATGVTYCKSLEGQSSCCTAETINNFQTRADELRTRLTAIASARDTVLVDTRKNVLPGLTAKINRLKTASDAVLARIKTYFTGDLAQYGVAVSALFSSYGDLSRKVTDNLNTLLQKVSTYQSSRSKCVVEMIKLQAAAWCLACDPNWASNGVDQSGKITISDTVCTRLTTACFDYLSLSNDQNAILTFKYLDPALDALSAIFEAAASGTGDPSAVNIDDVEVTMPSSDNEIPATLPKGCTATRCSFICKDIFTSSGEIDERLLGAGGELEESGTQRLSLDVPTRDAIAKKTRRLAGESGWNPSSDAAGVSVTFADNPGNVDTSSPNSGQLIKGAVACALTFVVVLLA